MPPTGANDNASAIATPGDAEALRASEERLRLAIKGAGIAVWDYDLISDRATLSPECCALVGLPIDTSASLDEAVRFVHPDYRASFTDAVATACDPGGTGFLSQEFRICRADTRETRWLGSTGQVYF